MANPLKTEIINYIINWNKRHPIDYWWRKKYGIPFGSEKHREANFIQMFYEYEEEKMMNNLLNPKEKEEEVNENPESRMSQNEIDDEFDKLDISTY